MYYVRTCAVGGCSNVADANQGILLHFIPFAGDDRSEAKKETPTMD